MMHFGEKKEKGKKNKKRDRENKKKNLEFILFMFEDNNLIIKPFVM